MVAMGAQVMTNTKEGGQKFRSRMIERFGSEEAYRMYMRELAHKGGKQSNTGGFASELKDKNGLTGAERASVYGRLGGRKSRRGPSKKGSDNE